MKKEVLMRRSGVTLTAIGSEIDAYKRAGFAIVEDEPEVSEDHKTFSTLNAEEMKALAEELGLETADTKKENKAAIEALDLEKDALQAVIDELEV